MASTSSSAAPRPAWQEVLFSIPERHRSFEQQIVTLTLGNLAKCDPRIFSVYNSALHNVDIKSPAMIESLFTIAHFLVCGNLESLRYYLSEEQAAAMLSPTSFLYNVCINAMFKEDFKKLKPKFLLPFIFAAIIAAAYQCMFCLVSESERTARKLQNLRLFEQCAAINSKVEINKALLPRLDKYIVETLGQRVFNTDFFVKKLSARIDSLRCLVDFDQNPISRESVDDFLQSVKCTVALHLSVSKQPEENVPCPINELLEYQMKLFAWYFMVLPSKEVANDPLFQEWWRVSDMYVDLILRELVFAKQFLPRQPMTVARLNSTLMNFLLYGASRNNSGFAEVEKVAKDLASAVRKCEAWAPPSWKLEMEEVLKTKKTFRRWMRDLPPEQLSTVCLVQENSPVEASRLRPGLVLVTLPADDIKAEKMCDACGKMATNLLKCSACRSVFYCNAECQKQDWKVHKNDCRELQWAKKEAAA